MTLNSKNIDFKCFFAIFGCKRVNCDEMDGDIIICEQELP